MEVTKYSRNHFYQTFVDWEVPKDYADVMYGYFVFGHHPGSFFTALLSNDFASAIASSHPANSIQGLKALVGWLRSTMLYSTAWGDSATVKQWLNKTNDERRAILVERGLVFTEQDEIVKALVSEPTVEPFLW